MMHLQFVHMVYSARCGEEEERERAKKNEN